jgi:hypothetical protein
MAKSDSHFSRKPLYEVLTCIDQNIRQMVLDSGFGELNLEFEPSQNSKYIQIVLKNTVHSFYEVADEDIQQLLSSGPHFPEHYVNEKLWNTLGAALHTILGKRGTRHGQINFSTAQKKHQQLFRISGGPSYQFYVDRTGMNI